MSLTGADLDGNDGTGNGDGTRVGQDMPEAKRPVERNLWETPSIAKTKRKSDDT